MTNLEWLLVATNAGSLVLVAIAGSRWTHWKAEAEESWRKAQKYWEQRNEALDKLLHHETRVRKQLQELNTERFYAANPQIERPMSAGPLTYERGFGPGDGDSKVIPFRRK